MSLARGEVKRPDTYTTQTVRRVGTDWEPHPRPADWAGAVSPGLTPTPAGLRPLDITPASLSALLLPTDQQVGTAAL